MGGVVIGEAANAGAKVSVIIETAADDWGGKPGRPTFDNAVKRRIQRALADIWSHNPNLKHYRIYNAEATLITDQHTYDVRDSEENGGFGWTNAYQVLQLVFSEVDNRPLEQLNLEQYRQRSELLDQNGPAESWFPIKSWEVGIYPPPDQAYVGVGDYLAEIPTIMQADAQLDWPKAYDHAIQKGVDWYFAKVRLRGRPADVAQYRADFYTAIEQIEANDRFNPARPQRAAATRNFRSSRYISRDNSRDRRWI